MFRVHMPIIRSIRCWVAAYGFCTEFVNGWWSWEPLRRSCVRCGWCRATAETCRAKNTSIKLPCCIKFVFYIISWVYCYHAYHLLTCELSQLSPNPWSFLDWSQNTVSEPCSERDESMFAIIWVATPYGLVITEDPEESIVSTSG